MRLLTVGHSTHPLDAFTALLAAHAVTAIADVRLIPRSKRHPQFTCEALAESLPAHGIAYRHFADLGGHRRPRPDSPNRAWRNESFRGYADYLQTPRFRAALDELLAWAGSTPAVAVMCAEAVWWRCHRQLIADALVARGHAVWHITSAAAPARHELTPFAQLRDQELVYPALW